MANKTEWARVPPVDYPRLDIPAFLLHKPPTLEEQAKAAYDQLSGLKHWESFLLGFKAGCAAR